jgi:hypothetical protein
MINARREKEHKFSMLVSAIKLQNDPTLFLNRVETDSEFSNPIASLAILNYIAPKMAGPFFWVLPFTYATATFGSSAPPPRKPAVLTGKAMILILLIRKD